MAALVIGFVASGPSRAQQIQNQLVNGNFETGAVAPWGTFGAVTIEVVTTCAGAAVPQGSVEGRYCLHVTVPAAGANYWDIGLSPQGMVFQKGKKYTLSAFLKCKKGTLQIDFKPQLGQDPWTGYGQKTFTMTEEWAEYSTTTPVLPADVVPPNIALHTGFAAAEFWIDDVKWYEGDYVPTVVKNKLGASSPVPDNAAVDVPRDQVLSWKAGPYAATHNVYLGTSFADVNSADTTKPQLVSKGQAGTSYDPPSLLDYGKTYYWRVDEVNAAPTNTVFKGDVWSFTVEPYVYPITGVTATASSYEKATTPPANTVNGSGLTGDLHGTDSATMWNSAMTDTAVWIQYQFDSVYKLYELWVWNHNTEVEAILGYGFRDATIEYSLDGTTWTLLGNVQFAQAPGTANYAHNTTVNLNGVMAKYVKLTPKSNWSIVGWKQYGLSEVRFYYIPVQARAPQPAASADSISVGSSLDWRPGHDVTSQKVYFGTNRAAVANGTAPVKTVTDHGYAPGALNFGTTYYWRVDEVNTVTYPGDVWKFTTQEYAVVDDFESYNDTSNRIYDTWIDGYGSTNNGSQVGYGQAPFAEQTIIHGGRQSMPFSYNNAGAIVVSEATRTFDSLQDWTISGANTLTLYFRGYPALTSVPVTETAGKMTLTGDGADIWGNSDDFTYAFKTLNADGSIVARVVDKGTGSNTWAKGGVMIRSSLASGSTHAMMVLTANSDGTAGNGYSFQWRPVADAASSSTDGTAPAITAPYWVKIQRVGGGLSGFVSADGKTWKQQGTTQLITTPTTVYVGLCVTSHAAGEQRTFQFDNVSTTGTVTGQWQAAVISSPQYNVAAPLYVTVQDSAGKKKTVVNPDAAAVTKAVWTQWKIALSDLAGVNLASVKKLTIGVGDSASPKAAAGLLYIDDILFGQPLQPVGLVAQYTLENNVKDVTGNGHDGTLIGTPTYVAGPAGKGMGLLFSGAPGQGIDLGTFNPSEKTGMLSVSLWAKWNGLSTQWQGLIGKRNTWDPAQMMWQIEASQTTGTLSFTRSGAGSAGAPALKVGEWTHIAVTFDKTTAKFYVNGSMTGQGAFSFGTNEDAAIEFGCDNAGGGNPFNGALDEVRLYDVVLTDAEILALAGK
jgi:hypothetical protein